MIAVLDTSVLVHLTTAGATAWPSRLSGRLAGVTAYVPDVIDVEFLHAMRGLALARKVSAERAEHARALFVTMPAIRMPTRELADRIWALRHNLTAYDGCFIALAEALDAPLITCDAKQHGASGHRAIVEVYGEPQP